MQHKAILALENGVIFEGVAIGAKGTTVGEIIFNTSMTGYQEILTDPSYAKQIITFTYPHIGNTGINDEDIESTKIWASGVVLKNLPKLYSNWRAKLSLEEYLTRQHIVGIAEIDTRALTQTIRDAGALKACIMTDDVNADLAVQQAIDFAGLNGMDLAKEVSTQKSYQWHEVETHYSASLQKNLDPAVKPRDDRRYNFHVVVLDYGVKRNILRRLAEHGCRITVVPAKTNFNAVMELEPDGVLLANGPGDPAACDYAIALTKELLKTKLPIFGICLGFQILALACGAKTIKMPFGHHGANHPVQDLQTKQVMITSQNHGFSVEESTIPKTLQITHRSLFDHTIQGIQHLHQPAFAFQGHPEASPGPHDAYPLFAKFIEMMRVHSPERSHAKAK